VLRRGSLRLPNFGVKTTTDRSLLHVMRDNRNGKRLCAALLMTPFET
jgi:hypothetical protein